MVESGPVGGTVVLPKGIHTLNISVSSMDMYGVEIDKVTVNPFCAESDMECSVTILEVPTNVLGHSTLTPDDQRWNKGHIISLAVGLSSTLAPVIIAIPTLIIAIWSMYKCVTEPSKLKASPSC